MWTFQGEGISSADLWVKSVTGNETGVHLPGPRPVGLVPKSKVGGWADQGIGGDVDGLGVCTDMDFHSVLCDRV